MARGDYWLILETSQPFPLPYMEPDEWINFFKPIHYHHEIECKKIMSSLKSDLPKEWVVNTVKEKDYPKISNNFK